MEELTALNQRDVAVLLAIASATVLFLQAMGRDMQGVRIGRVLVVPALGALGLALLIALLHGVVVRQLLSKILAGPASLALSAGMLIVALALVDLLFGRAVPILTRPLRALRVSQRAGGDVAMALLLTLGLVGFSALSIRLPATPAGNLVVGRAVADLMTFELPGEPMDVVLDGPSSGYLSLEPGYLARFVLPTGADGDLSLEIVADGLVHPRGVAIRGRELFVAELGAMPCTTALPQCTGWDLRPNSPVEGETEIVRSARGRLSVFQILSDGTLAAPRIVLTDLPVVSSEHGINGLTLGPDQKLYLTIGNVDLLWQSPTRADGLTPHRDWMGTVLRLDALPGEPEVFARGLRNVYQVTFDDRGDIWGVDNDGPSLGGWRGEEVIQIKEDHHYGYPHDGTLGSHSLRDDDAVWLIDQIGSAGIAWAGEAGLGPGLLIGSCGMVTNFELSDHGSRRGPFDTAGDGDVSPLPVLSGIPGCVTAIEVPRAGEVLATVFTYRDSGLLYFIRLR